MNLRLPLTILMLFASIAAHGAKPDRLVPDLPSPQSAQSAQTLRVMPIAKQSWKLRVPGTPTNDEYRQAVVLSLRRSNLFQSVVTDGNADLQLQILVASRYLPTDETGAKWEVRYECITTYKLLDAVTGKVLWTSDIRSVAGSTAFSGSKRIAESSEGSVRENLKAFVAQAVEQWPQIKPGNKPAQSEHDASTQ